MPRILLSLGLILVAGCALPKTGLLIMAHGGDPEWNQDVQTAVAPLKAEYPTEVAFGMATPSTLEAAVQKLEACGVEKIAVVRMFVSGDSFLDSTEFILGHRSAPPAPSHGAHQSPDQDHSGHAHDGHHEPMATLTASEATGGTNGSTKPDEHDHHHMEPPRRIRANAQFVLSRQGVAESPLIDQILVDRVRTLSRDSTRESILILGHGPGDDSENERWLASMQQRAARISEVGHFRAVKCETLREDWPEKRVDAEKRIRQFVEEGNRDGGRVIVVPFRVAGFGPYKEVLDGLNYVADGRGFCPHPNMTRWLQETLRETLATQ
ncbi:CbiX [Phycisphaerae bacterium RAS2]|nr:CbiX [Phycisphaerae bacterium RAS2]